MTTVITEEQSSANYYSMVENMNERYFTPAFLDHLLSEEDAHTCRMMLGAKHMSPATCNTVQLKGAILEVLAQTHVTLVA